MTRTRRYGAVSVDCPAYRLPTICQLASDLGLAKGTVGRAHLLLDADGGWNPESASERSFLNPRMKRSAAADADLGALHEAADALGGPLVNSARATNRR